jgi:hypothetical protein
MATGRLQELSSEFQSKVKIFLLSTMTIQLEESSPYFPVDSGGGNCNTFSCAGTGVADCQDRSRPCLMFWRLSRLRWLYFCCKFREDKPIDVVRSDTVLADALLQTAANALVPGGWIWWWRFSSTCWNSYSFARTRSRQVCRSELFEWVHWVSSKKDVNSQIRKKIRNFLLLT